jgi:hypothetical protein
MLTMPHCFPTVCCCSRVRDGSGGSGHGAGSRPSWASPVFVVAVTIPVLVVACDGVVVISVIEGVVS